MSIYSRSVLGTGHASVNGMMILQQSLSHTQACEPVVLDSGCVCPADGFVLLSFSRQRPAGMLLNISQCTRQAPATKHDLSSDASQTAVMLTCGKVAVGMEMCRLLLQCLAILPQGHFRRKCVALNGGCLLDSSVIFFLPKPGTLQKQIVPHSFHF